MNRELYIQTIKKKCAFLEQEGYTFNQIETNIFYIKKTEKEGFKIRFSWTEYGDDFYTYGLSAEKRFNIVEQEIQRAVGGELDYYTIYINPPLDCIPKNIENLALGEDKMRFNLNTVNDIDLFVNFVKEFYSKTALDFFKNHETLSCVDIQLKELLENRKIQSILTSLDNTTILRFYVIAIISENQSIKDFFNSTYFQYLNDNLDNEINKVEKDRLEKIQNSLSSKV